MNRYWPMLLTLAAVWGASYLFIKVAVDEIEPAPMMAFRTLLAAAVLLGYVVWRLGREPAVAGLRAAWRHGLVLGVFNAALPFWLIAWGEQYIDSGPRRGRAGVGADLQRAAGPPLPPCTSG